MYLFECETMLEAEPARLWAVWTDVARWPEWDASKEIARLDGPFEPGVSGWAKQRGTLGGSFTITVVEAGRRWVSECPVPGQGCLRPCARAGRTRTCPGG